MLVVLLLQKCELLPLIFFISSVFLPHFFFISFLWFSQNAPFFSDRFLAFWERWLVQILRKIVSRWKGNVTEKKGGPRSYSPRQKHLSQPSRRPKLEYIHKHTTDPDIFIHFVHIWMMLHANWLQALIYNLLMLWKNQYN